MSKTTQTSAPKTLVICNRQVYSNHPWAIHAADCSDVARNEVPGNRAGTHSAITTLFTGSVDDAIKSILDPDMVEMGYGEEHIAVYPCCRRK